ncbi:MAG: chorismate synthase [Paludibacteraceae bacterium]|nr:chorismate synthase [Paludibacteraceae bacterium]
MNNFGDTFVFTSFGESHSAAIGGVLDGVPAGLHIDFDMIREALDRRAGRQSLNAPYLQIVPLGKEHSTLNTQRGVSPRALREADEIEWLSGVMDGVTLGTPIAFIIRNRDARPEDYEALKHSFRPAHADSTYEAKYGIRDWRGGGRASARETAARVVAGNIAAQMLAERGITIKAQLVQVGAETNAEQFSEVIRRYQTEGDSIGGIIRCEVTGLPAGLGEPIFDKMQAHLAYAIMSINACKGFDYGSGFAGVSEPGSVANRQSGGLLGGITDGTTLSFRCVFKPTPTTPKALKQMQNEAYPHPLHEGSGEDISGKLTVGRHDACVAVRAVPVVEAMTALVLANFISMA